MSVALVTTVVIVYALLVRLWLRAYAERVRAERFQCLLEGGEGVAHRNDRVAVIVPVAVLDQRVYPLLQSLEQQSHNNYEVIVVFEHGAPPRSHQAKGKICYIHNPEASHAERCNKASNLLVGLRSAREAEILVFLDDDVMISPMFLSQMVTFIERTPGAIVTAYRHFETAQTVKDHLLAVINNSISYIGLLPRWRCVWGGCFGLRASVASLLDLKAIWSIAISDDLALTYAACKKGVPIEVFAVAPCVSVPFAGSLAGLGSWAVRQFRLARFWSPREYCDMLFISAAISGAAVVLLILARSWMPAAVGMIILFHYLFFAGPLGNVSRLKVVSTPKAVLAAALAPLLVLVLCLLAATGREIRWKGRVYRPPKSRQISRWRNFAHSTRKS